MKRLLHTVGVLGLVVALPLMAGCGGDDNDGGSSNGGGDQSATNAPERSGDGAWRGEFDTGTKVTLEIFVDPADVPELAEFIELREEAGREEPIRYARVRAENVTDAPDRGRFATLTDEQGEQFGDGAITLEFLCSKAYRWLSDSPSDEAIALYNDLFTGTCLGQELQGPEILAGETVTYFLTWEGEGEPEFDRVFMGLNQEFER